MHRRGEIAEGFLAAAVEPARWLGALERLASATGSDHAQIIGIGPDYSLDFNWVTGMSAADHAKFDRDEMVAPASNFRVAAGIGGRIGAVIGDERYDTFRDALVDDAYLDMCSDLRIPHGCQTNLRHDANGLLGFALLRSQRSGPAPAEARDLFAQVAHDAATAAALQVALEREGHRLVSGTFEAMGRACFVLDRRMQVCAFSPPAEALLREGVLKLADGRVALPDAVEDRRLAQATAAVAAGRTLAGQVAAADRPACGGTGTMVLRLYRLPAREWAMGFAPFAVMIVSRAAPALADVTLLRDTYRLTAAESEIALLLRAGRSRDAICESRGITRETLRSHLRALFAKLGVNRETEAIHLLHTLLA